jgi:hypothetical protein
VAPVTTGNHGSTTSLKPHQTGRSPCKQSHLRDELETVDLAREQNQQLMHPLSIRETRKELIDATSRETTQVLERPSA